MRILALAVITLLCSVNVWAKKELGSEEFLKVARTPSARDYWVKMNGNVMNKRRGGSVIKAPLFFSTLFTPKRAIAKVIIDEKQGYKIGQVYGTGDDMTSIIPLKKGGYKKSILSQYGLRPDDLTMSFIYWTFYKELKRDSVKMQDCRVFVLKSVDGKEFVRVFFSAEYFFPLKVQWFCKDKKSPHRNLEVSSYKKVKKVYVPSELKLYGPGWRTKVKFDDIEVGNITKGGSVPKDLF